jgi:hypothetical protein
MRMIGQLSSEASAKVFGGYLSSLEIKNLVEPDSGGIWNIWVYCEDQVEKGRQLLTGYLQDPNDQKFQQALQKAAELKGREQVEQKGFEKRAQTREMFWPRIGIGPLTLILIAVSALLAFVSNLGANVQSLHSLFISEHPGAPVLSEIQSGEVWRLLTPTFQHALFERSGHSD